VKNKLFLKWLLSFNLVLLASVFAWIYGIFDRVYIADITKISFLIYILLIITSVKIGIDTYKISSTNYFKKMKNKNRQKGETNITAAMIVANEYKTRQNQYDFIANTFVKLGIIGTVIGISWMLSSVFTGLDPSNIPSMQSSIALMGTGLGTALYTTGAGLICNLILKIQNFQLSEYIDREIGNA